MKNILIIALVIVLAVIATQTARPLQTGVAWDFGGIDKDGIFLCPAAVTYDGSGNVINYWTNPLYGVPALDSLFVDC